jgi:hypothetical protein
MPSEERDRVSDVQPLQDNLRLGNLEDDAMKMIANTLAVALAFSATAALAQTTKPEVSGAPSAQNSGAGIAGQPGNKNGPAAKSGDTVGSSSSAQQNSTVQQQDASKIQGLPGNKSGPTVKPEGK